MKTITLIIISCFALILTVNNANCHIFELPCYQDHYEPPVENLLPDKLGEYAGFGALTLLLTQGGFGCPENIKQQIISMNSSYQNNDYLPRWREAVQIQKWLESKHLIYEPPEPPTVCPVCGRAHNLDEFKTLVREKVARRDQLTTEIDTIATNLSLDAWDLLPHDTQNAYLAWVETLVAQ